jgi:phosphoribosylformylglycinamidine synthase
LFILVELNALTWLLSETYEPENFGQSSFLEAGVTNPQAEIIEVGPRLNFTSAFSTNAVSICRNCNLPVSRLERYRRYRLFGSTSVLDSNVFAQMVHDRMTEWRLSTSLTTFDSGLSPEPVRIIPLLTGGKEALQKVNKEMGLSMDDWDIDFYYNLFVNDLRRDPTDVELFDISQSNSEHSRHWFFKGKMVIDGIDQGRNLMEVVGSTLKANPANSVIAFADNSSAIKGYHVDAFISSNPGKPAPLTVSPMLRHCLLTAETHNFPTGVAPFPGAATGTGGRIRDTHATGKGSHVIAGTAAYCVGNLHIPGYPLPWEEELSFQYPSNLASPLTIEIDASNGASNYGNEFGEPIIIGFTRSVGMKLSNGERREYIKPIMFTAGIGAIEEEQIVKETPRDGMVVVKLGGPAYRIGMGGSAASSMMQGENKAELDFNAVQRGDAEMEQKVNRVIRACCELGLKNPIATIHDQGAGGNCNVLKEIVSPTGGVINIRKVLVGDKTLSVLEIWGAEYQEADALLINEKDVSLFTEICARERAPVAYVGHVSNTGRVQLYDSLNDTYPVDMDLEKVLGNMPQKTFTIARSKVELSPFKIPNVTLYQSLDRVLRSLAVGSKRFLTNKVDRAVTGLIAQQQCVGPLHTPLSDCGVVSLSFFDTKGIASSIGEQPLKGLISPHALGRMSVAEAITNIAGAKITSLKDAKCSANWMWAAKLPHEGAALYDACVSMSEFMIQTGIAVDGGKDSLSMAAKAPDGELVKAPGSLVISLYAPCPDITLTVTPDLKYPGSSSLILLDLSPESSKNLLPRYRIGGSAFGQVYNQLGNLSQVIDCEDSNQLVTGFNLIQSFVEKKVIKSIHDRSDGGIITTLLEMAFAGNCGIAIDMKEMRSDINPLEIMFSEELGWVVEVLNENVEFVLSEISHSGLLGQVIGQTKPENLVSINLNGSSLLNASMTELRDIWEATSFQLERLQTLPVCVEQEEQGMKSRKNPPYSLSFQPALTDKEKLESEKKPKVVILREEGSNGDREMASACYLAGFNVWDVTMTDLITGRVVLDESIQGVIFPGGFSYADVLDSGKGWAGTIKFDENIVTQFRNFYFRKDTFSLGVCNGCQLAALLGFVPFGPIDDVNEIKYIQNETQQPRMISNLSGRFESRFPTVRINKSNAIMFKGMEGSVLGVWSQHGEGRVHFPDPVILEKVKELGCIPMQYVNDAGLPTEVYPLNPNGSIEGIAGLCSPDGRHLAVMPHPERVHLNWQWPYMPEKWKEGGEEELLASPWLKMFQNARDWCVSVRKE